MTVLNPVKKGFTLIEVVLAVGVLGIAILSLVMMFGPTMKSVSEVVSANEASAAVDYFNEFLQNEAHDKPTSGYQGTPSDFDTVASWVANDQEFWVYATTTNNGQLEITTDSADIDVTSADFVNKLNSGVLRIKISQMASGYDYADVSNQAYLPMLVEIFSVPTDNPTTGNAIKILDYNNAVLR